MRSKRSLTAVMLIALGSSVLARTETLGQEGGRPAEVGDDAPIREAPIREASEPREAPPSRDAAGPRRGQRVRRGRRSRGGPGGAGPSARNADPVRLTREGLKVGFELPNLVVFDESGKEFSTTSLKGSYSVLVFGCLT